MQINKECKELYSPGFGDDVKKSIPSNLNAGRINGNKISKKPVYDRCQPLIVLRPCIEKLTFYDLCFKKKEGAYTLCNGMDGTGEHYAK